MHFHQSFRYKLTLFTLLPYNIYNKILHKEGISAMQKIKHFLFGELTTIREKLLRVVVSLIIISLVILGAVSCILNYYSTLKTLEQTMHATVKVASERVEWELEANKNIAREIGTVARFTSDTVSLEDKKALVDQKVETYNLISGDVLDENGVSIFDGTDYSDAAFFKSAMNGDSYVSVPVEKEGDDIDISIAAPLWKGGIAGAEVAGVVVIVPDKQFLNVIAKSIQISPNGYAYIISKDGTSVAHPDESNVLSMNNIIKTAETNSSLKALAEYESKLINGEDGYGKYRYKGETKLIAYAPIEETDGWGIAVVAPLNDFMAETYAGVIITIIILIVAFLFGYRRTVSLANSIGNPIKQCADRLELLAHGSLDEPVPDISSNDEIGVLANSTAFIVDSLSGIINDINYLLNNMAEGNFNIHSTAKELYIGGYAPIYDAMVTINHSLSHALQGITEATDQVAAGSGQLAESATDLATGATDQAGVVEELLATITDFSNQVRINAEKASDTSKDAKAIGEKASTSSQQMVAMNSAMQRISDASNEIGNIIASIEAIATQTNLLSLNASIEAARAGESGSGFAVVANEIGQLAKQCSAAVDNTRQLIQTALSEVENGMQITDETISSLNDVIVQIGSVVEQVEDVARTSQSQSETMVQLNKGVEQIADVVESNSATAEECSATSEELSAQASTLDDLVGQFTLAEITK